MKFIEVYLLSVCFFTALWVIPSWLFNRAEEARRKKYAENHFKLTERYRNGIH